MNLAYFLNRKYASELQQWYYNESHILGSFVLAWFFQKLELEAKAYVLHCFRKCNPRELT